KGTGTATITDDDAAPVVSIVPTAAVAEGDTGNTRSTLDVTLSAASGLPAQVNFSSADGPGISGAVSGADYTVDANGTVTFAAGTQAAAAVVQVKADAVQNEPDETFTVTISNPVAATIDPSNATGTGTIKDNTPGGTPHVAVTTSTLSVQEHNSGTT